MWKLLNNKMERTDGGLTEFTAVTLTEITELNHKTVSQNVRWSGWNSNSHLLEQNSEA